jgi:single-strand DNA-binding protein
LARLAAEYLKKGSLVLVEGKLRYRSYEEEGVGVKYVTEIIADRLLMLDKRVIDRPVDNESLDFSDGHLPF